VHVLADPGTILGCGDHFDGRSDGLGGPVEILICHSRIRELAAGVDEFSQFITRVLTVLPRQT
jgi:hypothetical protein